MKVPAASTDEQDVELLDKAKPMEATQTKRQPKKKIDAQVPLRHLSLELSVPMLRDRIRQGHIKNIFDMAREGKFGNVLERGPEREKGIRKMYQKLVKDTKDGSDAAANADYFLQIMEEGWPSSNDEGLQEFPFLAVKMFKLLLILVSYRKPPSPATGPDSLTYSAMTPQQVLDIVSREIRDVLRPSLPGL